MILNDRVTVLSADDASVNSQGNTIYDWENAPTVIEPAFVGTLTGGQPSTDEYNVSQDQVTTSRLAVLLPQTSATAGSRVLWHGLEFEVDGEVMPITDLRGRTHHCEAVLRRVTG